MEDDEADDDVAIGSTLIVQRLALRCLEAIGIFDPSRVDLMSDFPTTTNTLPLSKTVRNSTISAKNYSHLNKSAAYLGQSHAPWDADEATLQLASKVELLCRVEQ